MFGNGSLGRGGRDLHQEDWGHKFWLWVSDLKDPNAPTMLNRGGDLANTGVAFNFCYEPEDDELSVNLQIGGKGDDAERSLRSARNQVEQEISGEWDWNGIQYNEGHGETYLFGRIKKEWDVNR